VRKSREAVFCAHSAAPGCMKRFPAFGAAPIQTPKPTGLGLLPPARSLASLLGAAARQDSQGREGSRVSSQFSAIHFIGLADRCNEDSDWQWAFAECGQNTRSRKGCRAHPLRPRHDRRPRYEISLAVSVFVSSPLFPPPPGAPWYSCWLSSLI
jgi:hypothetical protein